MREVKEVTLMDFLQYNGKFLVFYLYASFKACSLASPNITMKISFFSRLQEGKRPINKIAHCKFYHHT